MLFNFWASCLSINIRLFSSGPDDILSHYLLLSRERERGTSEGDDGSEAISLTANENLIEYSISVNIAEIEQKARDQTNKIVCRDKYYFVCV